MAKPTGIEDNGGREPATVCGIPLVLFPADPTYGLKLQRATDAAFSANLLTVVLPPEQSLYLDPLPNDGTTRYYRAAHTGRGEADSAWTPTVTGTPALFPLAAVYRLEQMAAEARRRNDTLYSQDGQVKPGTTVAEGTSGKALMRNYQTGTVADGGTVTFARSYQGVPVIRLSGGISYQPDSAKWTPSLTTTAPQYDDLAGLSPTTTGFTARGKLRQPGTRTANTIDFQNVTRSAVGDTDVATLATNPGSTDETYAVRYKCDVTVLTLPSQAGSATLTIAIETSVDGGTNYIERARTSYVVNTTGGAATASYNTEVVTISAPSLTSSAPADKIRLKVVALDVSAGADGSFTMHGFTVAVDGTAGVTYYTSTDATASKTPTTGDLLTWEAWEYA